MIASTWGWQSPWYSLRDDFDADHDVAEWHGTNVFLRDGDDVYRTYLVDARGDEALGSAWSFLDITPYGRQEEWEDSPEGWPQTPPVIAAYVRAGRSGFALSCRCKGRWDPASQPPRSPSSPSRR